MPDTNEPRFGDATLTDCDREPIHLAGSIQPHGCLIVLDADDLVVQRAGDFRRVLGDDVDDPLGLPLGAVVGAAAERILNSAHAMREQPLPLGSCDIEFETPQGLVDASLYESDGQRVVEFQPASRAGGGDALTNLQRMLAALATAPTLATYCQVCVEQIRAATAFDRVMLYQFLEDGSGKVVAEAKDVDVESFLDLRYPESDIPKQARALYAKNWIRSIPDVGYTPAPIEPATNPVTGRPLDLTSSTLRSVSPLHVRYLQNMGVAASMSVSVMYRGTLWGLIACHHRTRHLLPCDVRAACEMFGQVFSLQLDSRLRAEDYEYRLQQRSVHQQLVARLAREENLCDGLIRYRPNLLDLVQADGVAVWVEGGFAEIGRTPGSAGVQHLVRLLNARDDEGVFASDRMAEIFPGVGADAAGVLALSVSRTPKDWILWFRREIVDTVTWAGNPNKAVDRAPGDGRLTPRESFRAWRETVRGRSRPWKPLEIEAAQSLRLAILEVVLQRIDQLARARAEAHEQQTLLLAELDHRVKNMLANIRAVMRFTRRSNDTLDSYVENLDRRVKSMAHAQSLLSASRWRGAELRRLVDEELRAYEGADRAISIEGPTIELTPKAALSVSMVLHELATNAAKYGSLSSAGGRLAVRWTLDDAGLRLAWRETGGPTVRRPERRGFGRMLVETSVAYELEGEVDLRFEPEGVACDVAIPSHFVLTPALPHSRRDVGAGAAKPAAVLVVEDSMITALDLADTLEAAGYRPIGPTGRVEDALVMVDQEAPDVAVLDVNLGDTTSFPVADRLADKRIPFVFLTGYDPNGSVPARFAEVPCLAKPCSDEELRTALTRALGR